MIVKKQINSLSKYLQLQVRCAGAKHSWSPMFPDEGNILMYNQDIQRHDGPRIELIKVRVTTTFLLSATFYVLFSDCHLPWKR